MEILTNFGVQPKLLLAQIVNFLIIFFLLKKFFYGKITKALDDRKQKIQESLKNAELIDQKLQETEEKTAQILNAARLNSKNIIEEAQKAAQLISAQAQEEARETQEEMLASAKVQIETQRLQMQKDLEKETLTLVIMVVEKVLGKNLKKPQQQQLTKQAIAEITKQIS